MNNHHHHHHHHNHHPSKAQYHTLNEEDEPFNLPEILFRDDDDDDLSPTSSHDNNNPLPQFPQNASISLSPISNPNPNSTFLIHKHSIDNNNNNKRRHYPEAPYISPDPHISSQFYTFNKESHGLMIRCLREGRVATPDEIRGATPPAVLVSWRTVWKDRNEDTAYLTAWKRIQEKLNTHVNGENGNVFLCFKNNSSQCVSHVDQWQEIVMNYHADGDLKHLGLKETIDRIKQLWTVGAKFYGIPESYIRTCVAACPVCSDESSGVAPRGKRRRFEYTESIELPAKDVPTRLQQLAAKHKVVLCIRQKYIRYKPFMAEVKDYACHRAGEPASAKKSKILKREPYASKRCGCGFRIRAIVPISNYNEKEKTFVYEEEGVAVFKLYAVHSGHEPGPLDGNARIMHRVVGNKGGFMIDQDTIYGVSEEAENDAFGFLRKDEGDLQHAVLQKVQELRNEVGMLEGRIAKIPSELMGSVSRELSDIVNKLRNVGEYGSNAVGLLSDKHSDDILVGESDLADWTDQHHRIYGNGKDAELLEEDEDSFERTLGEVARWEQLRADCEVDKDLLGETCKPEKWLKCSDFDDKSILDCGDSKLRKALGHDETLDGDVGLGIQVDTFYPEHPKWFDSPCDLDTGTECSDGGFRHGEIV
ncbi:hypothetical protein Leryth_015508 [Lithospermum erythrorhizon]|nr:hypothetical protein Leryth_015508 [Lithospermum erythrorhizon]